MIYARKFIHLHLNPLLQLGRSFTSLTDPFCDQNYHFHTQTVLSTLSLLPSALSISTFHCRTQMLEKTTNDGNPLSIFLLRTFAFCLPLKNSKIRNNKWKNPLSTFHPPTSSLSLSSFRRLTSSFSAFYFLLPNVYIVDRGSLNNFKTLTFNLRFSPTVMWIMGHENISIFTF